MSPNIWSDYPPAATEDQLAYLVQKVKDWTIFNGLTVRPNPALVGEDTNPNHVLATNAPVTLYPSPFPKRQFEQAQKLQKIYNELYAVIASDEAWLEEVMKEVVEVDEFMANLWNIHLKVKQEGYVQDKTLGLFRSDYMLHIPEDGSSPALKQVEFNTISSSFGGLSVRVAQMHTELVTYPLPGLAYPAHDLFNGSHDQAHGQARTPPPNRAVETLTGGLIEACDKYRLTDTSTALPSCIAFLVQDGERNLFDQMALSTYIQQTRPDIPSFRVPVSQILAQLSIPPTSENPRKPLIYTSPANPALQFEVAVVYFRALYAPTEYDTPVSWAARHHLERSSAIKCPSVLLHLTGSKKIQQVLADRTMTKLEKFLPQAHPDDLESLRSSFAPQYSMSDGPESEGVKIALDPQRAENHVLKPQREGGGNNTYRSNIPKLLKSIPERDYKQYVLMELIKTPEDAKNVVLRSDGQVVTGNVITEVGIFGTCLWSSKVGSPAIDMLHNDEGGYLVRTKARDSDEGGVAAGFSSLDSMVLFDE